MSTEKVMVSGSTTATEAFFEKYYVPKLEQFVRENAAFLVGGARGVDQMTQQYLIDVGYEPSKVTVVDKGEQDNRLSKAFSHQNGFDSYPKRDAWMTAHSTVDVATVCQYGGGGSGTFANLLRRQLDDATARRVQKLFRNNAEAYETK